MAMRVWIYPSPIITISTNQGKAQRQAWQSWIGEGKIDQSVPFFCPLDPSLRNHCSAFETAANL